MTDNLDSQFPQWDPHCSPEPSTEAPQTSEQSAPVGTVIDFEANPRAGFLLAFDLISRLLEEAPYPLVKAKEIIVALHFVRNLKKTYETSEIKEVK